MGDSEVKWQGFFCAVRHSEEEYLLETLKEYDLAGYIISKEITKNAHVETDGEHFHFCVEMSDKDYHKYAKRVFKDKYKLRGQAKKGKPRQYGKLLKIESLERLKAYTIKDNNFITNLTEKEIEKLKEISYKRQEKRTKREELIEVLTYKKYVIYAGKGGYTELELARRDPPYSRFEYWKLAMLWQRESEDNFMTNTQIDNIIDYVVTYKNTYHTIGEAIDIRKSRSVYA